MKLKELFGKTKSVYFMSADNIVKLPVVEGSVELECKSTFVRKEIKPVNIHMSLNPSKDHWIKDFIGNRYDVEITTNDRIRKPTNLKYPNKKRARRIWKKWRNRYGIKPGKQTIIKNCKILVE